MIIAPNICIYVLHSIQYHVILQIETSAPTLHFTKFKIQYFFVVLHSYDYRAVFQGEFKIQEQMFYHLAQGLMLYDNSFQISSICI